MSKTDYKGKYEELKDSAIFMTIVACVLFVMVFSICIFAQDNLDMDDVVGPYLCKQHGLEFDSMDTSFHFGKNVQSWDHLKIYCKPYRHEVELDDGYLIKLGEPKKVVEEECDPDSDYCLKITDFTWVSRSGEE